MSKGILGGDGYLKLKEAELRPSPKGCRQCLCHEAQKQNESRGREVKELSLKLDTKEPLGLSQSLLMLLQH